MLRTWVPGDVYRVAGLELRILRQLSQLLTPRAALHLLHSRANLHHLRCDDGWR